MNLCLAAETHAALLLGRCFESVEPQFGALPRATVEEQGVIRSTDE